MAPELLKPFAHDGATAKAFDRWRSHLAAAGVEVLAPLTYILGAVAAAETALDEVHRARVAEKDAATRLKLVEAERRLTASFLVALGKLDDAASEAGQHAVTLPRPELVGKVLPMPALDRRAGKGAGRAAVRARILAALRKHGPIGKDALREVVKADDTAFAEVLKTLVAAGEVQRTGAGVKFKPHLYEVA